MSFTLEPNHASVSKEGELIKINLISKANHKFAFKIKCSNNKLYRVKSNSGFIDPGKTQEIDVLKLQGQARDDRIIIYLLKADDLESDATSMFQYTVHEVQLEFKFNAKD